MASPWWLAVGFVVLACILGAWPHTAAHAGSKVKANIRYCTEHPAECSRPQDQPGLVIGIGAQKCGTSSLAGFLAKMEGIVKMRKEMHFFDRQYAKYEDEIEADREQGLANALQGYYDKWGPQPIRGKWLPMEISPVYMYDRRVAFRMMDVLRPRRESVRLVALVRDPVPRAYSGFFQLDDKADPGDFHDLVAREAEVIRRCYIQGLMFVNEAHCHSAEEQYAALRRCVREVVGDGRPWYERSIVPLNNNYSRSLDDNGYSYWMHEGLLLRGIYVDQLKNFLCAGWRPEQIFISTTSQLHAHPHRLATRLADFVGPPARLAGPFKRRLKSGETIHRGTAAGGHAPMEERTKAMLADFYREYNLALVHFLRQHNFACDVGEVEEELGLLVSSKPKDQDDDDDDVEGGDDDDEDDDDSEGDYARGGGR